MTDKERLLTFLDGAGYTVTDEDPAGHHGFVTAAHGHRYYLDDPAVRNGVQSASTVRVGQGGGYRGFFVDFDFTEAGALVDHSV